MTDVKTLAAKLITEYRKAADLTGAYDPTDPEGLSGFVDGGWQEHVIECEGAGVDPMEVLDEAKRLVQTLR